MKTKTWVKVDTIALRDNFNNLKSLLSEGTKAMVVVKSNAYGHGMVECAKIYSNADFLGVDSIEEALQIREIGVTTPILVLGWTSSEMYKEAAEKDISITISSTEMLEKVDSTNVKVHLKVDTGLHRQGFAYIDLKEVSKLVREYDINVEGLYTHLAGAETSNFDEYTKLQAERFNEWVEEFKDLKPITHIGASSVALRHDDIHFDMVRLGISLYGLWPSEELAGVNRIELKPALTWESVITEVKEVKKGEPIGYDCTEEVNKDSTVAVVPIGYWHGLPRAASRKAHFLVNGEKCKILGNVSMDMTVVDVTDADVKEGDIVTIIGDNNPVENLAMDCNTINYEIVTRINSEIPRIYNF